jgi:hypothetical protein
MHKYKIQISLEEICLFELDILFSFEAVKLLIILQYVAKAPHIW